MTTTESPAVDNGVNVDALLGARAAMTDMPAAAQFQWRADCTWVNGTHARTTVESFSGIGAEQSHRTAYSIDTDHPEVFASADNGPTPPELMLMGLAGCLTAGVASVATHRGIQLRAVTATVEGDMDLQGILGIDADVRNGFGAIRVRFEIDADATKDELEAVVAQSQKRSAVFDVIANPTNIVVDVA
ncbi:MAG: OsmC family peroxiredoxin [Acidimicrobiales bacterium]|nr:MAG: OsmC family peroxiredoxin [Acidimicrobiales bacterium]